MHLQDETNYVKDFHLPGGTLTKLSSGIIIGGVNKTLDITLESSVLLTRNTKYFIALRNVCLLTMKGIGDGWHTYWGRNY